MFRELKGRVLLEHVYARDSAMFIRNNNMCIKMATPNGKYTVFNYIESYPHM